MRIIFVIYGELSTLSGGYLYDRMLLRHLYRHGDQVRVISLANGSWPRHLLDNLSGRIRRAFKREPVDVIIQDELCHPSLVITNRLLSKGRPPIVSLVHHLTSDEQHPPVQKKLYRAIERSYLRSVDAIIANTQVTLDRVGKVSGKSYPSVIAPPSSALEQPPVMIEEIEQRLEKVRPLRVIFVGNLIPRKMLHVLLEAIHTVLGNGTPVQATVVGGDDHDPDYAAQVRTRYAALIKDGTVVFAGQKRGTELANLYRDHDLLVVPSSYEGFGMVYLEGMAYGLPAIGAAAGGAREIIDHGSNGWLLEPGDTDTLAGYLATLARDRTLLSTMSRAARRTFDHHPDWDESMNRIRTFLQELVT